MNTAYVDYSVIVDCPKCSEQIDISKDDDDSVVASAIFHNNWEALEGYEVVCGFCNHEFELDSVEY